VQDGAGTRLPQEVGQRGRVAGVALDQRDRPRTALTRNRRLDGCNRAGMPGREVVEDNDVSTGQGQRLDRVTPDVAGAPGDDEGAQGRPAFRAGRRAPAGTPVQP
jgi:hypothetical protein